MSLSRLPACRSVSERSRQALSVAGCWGSARVPQLGGSRGERAEQFGYRRRLGVWPEKNESIAPLTV